MAIYKVLADDGSCLHGGQGAWSLPNGEGPGAWMPPVEGELELCRNGYHVLTRGQLIYWLGPAIWEVEHRGEIVRDDDKCVVREARLVRRLDTWNDRTARLFAADCAARALQRGRKDYQAKRLKQDVDPRSVAAVAVARQVAVGEADEAARSAAWWSAARSAAEWSAARSAAGWSAARSAAWWSAAESAAWSAAESAAWSAARWSAARSAAEWSAARSAAWWSAAESAERKWQTARLWCYLNGAEPRPVPLPKVQPK